MKYVTLAIDDSFGDNGRGGEGLKDIEVNELANLVAVIEV